MRNQACGGGRKEAHGVSSGESTPVALLWPPYHDVENHADDEAHAEAVEALRRGRR